MKVLFWDIDGTLIRTGAAGLYAFDQAVREVYHRSADYSIVKTQGMTDDYIAAEIVELLTGRTAQAEDVARLTARYEQLLPKYLAEKPGLVLHGIAEVLDTLDKREDVAQLILTGNSARGAKEKLDYYRLSSYFDFTRSAFGDGCRDRNEISAKAKQIVKQYYPSVAEEEVYVIGDTPNDIRCGKAIGARTIAIASGRSTREELASHTPWWAIEEMVSPEEFLAHLALR